MVTEIRNIDYLAKKNIKKFNLNTGDVSAIFQFSRHFVIDSCKKGWLQHYKVSESSHRRITIDSLVNVVKNWPNLKSCYPQQQLLHFMEVVGLNPTSYGLNGLAGKDGLRFHTQQALYRTGEFAYLIKVPIQTIDHRFGKGRIEGYRFPNSKFRIIPVGAVARYVRDNKIPLREDCEIAPSPDIITYPDYYLGYNKGREEWINGTKVMETDDKKSVWYRSSEGLHEVSIRRNEHYGLYIKLAKSSEPKPRIDLILLCDASKTLEGGILPKEEHLNRVYELLKIGAGLSIDQCSIALNRLLEVYPEFKERKS